MTKQGQRPVSAFRCGEAAPARGGRLEMRAVWVLGLLFGFWGALAGGQDLRYLSHQGWSTEEGLPQNSVHAIAQTPDGFLWVGTEGGLARFDGVSFRVYGKEVLPSADVCCLQVDRAGLLVGTADGTVREEAGRFLKPAADAAGQPGARSLPAGWRWSATSVGFGQREWLVGAALAGRVQAVLVDRAGLAWVGMRNGLAVLHPADGSVKPVEALGGNSVLSLFEDLEGNHWVGTETTGLHVLRRLRFRGEAGLSHLAVTSVTQTANGAMWVGTRDDGLRRVRGGVVDAPVPAEKLTSAVVLAMAADERGGLWVGTPDGLNFIGRDLAVLKLTSAEGLPDDYVRSLAAGPDGSVWVGTRHGLAWLRAGRVERVFSRADGLGGDGVGALLRTAGGLWVGTSGGLSILDADGKVRAVRWKDATAKPIVTAMAEAHGGGVWVATSGGGVSLFGEDGVELGRSFAARTGVSVDGITGDRLGTLWFRLDRGIERRDEAKLRECTLSGGCGAEGGVGWFGMADGLPSDEVVAGETSGGWLARDGEMWFPTRRGVAIVDTGYARGSEVPPPVVVERFLVDDVDAGEQARLPYGHQRLTFEFAGLSFTAPSEVQYRYRLEGFDKDWQDGGGRRSATYTNLAPGSYRFRVEARNNNGIWNRAGAEVAFRVVPPYYRRWWFLLLMGVLLVLVLVGLYLLRLRGLRRQFDAVLAERNRMAREIHDTLTQDFVGTSLQLDIVAQMLKRGKVEAALEQVVRTRRLVTEGLDEARQSIWELRANNAEDSLPTRLTRLLQREVFVAIAPKLHVGGAYRELDYRVEREVLRVAQEALSNTLKHAGASETTVNLHYSDEALLLTIEDNGAGFVMEEAARMSGHFGLVGMRERAAMIDGAVMVESAPGKGTTVTLRAPLEPEKQPKELK